MLSAVSGIYGNYGAYMYGRYAGAAASAGAVPSVKGAQGAQGVASLSVHRAAQPDVPVEPVRPVPSVKPAAKGDINLGALLQRQASDPAEMAVRMRIQYGEPGDQANGAAAASLSGAERAGSPAARGAELPGVKEQDAGEGASLGVEGAQKAAEEGRCETCEKRRYQDGSDDPGVSFKTPTRMSPDRAASAVRGHEQEHVVREQAKAAREGREVVSQSVTLHTDICPECGRVYVSGGVTETVTAAQKQPEPESEDAARGFAGVA